MARFYLLALLVLSVYASNLRLESKANIAARKAAVEGKYTQQTTTGDFEVWREESQMIWGWNNSTQVEAGYMIDSRTDNAMKYDEGWYHVKESEVPEWVWEKIEESQEAP